MFLTSACQCNPNGTIGDCDTLFGTCTCLGPNILGDTCNECADGFWGLSQGSGCIPCDCCNNGSLNNICDKVCVICILDQMYVHGYMVTWMYVHGYRQSYIYTHLFRILVDVIVYQMSAARQMTNAAAALQVSLTSLRTLAAAVCSSTYVQC